MVLNALVPVTSHIPFSWVFRQPIRQEDMVARNCSGSSLTLPFTKNVLLTYYTIDEKLAEEFILITDIIKLLNVILLSDIISGTLVLLAVYPVFATVEYKHYFIKK